MGNYCSHDDAKDGHKKSSKKPNKEREAKYAVKDDATEGPVDSNSVPSESSAAPKPSAQTQAPIAPNPALAKKSSYSIVPKIDNAVIIPNTRDPADYEANNLKDTTWVRVPGQINDQRINISNCINCTFVLLDQCDSVQIDDCEGCKFYIGPTAGSVFIRTSKNCTFVAACGQLRTRDLHDSKLALFCHSRPVIESSKNIGIGCYPSYLGYHQLLYHMCKASMSQFTNLYYFVHDFTPSKKSSETNFYIIPQSDIEGDASFFPKISSMMPDVLSETDDKEYYSSQVVIPYVGCGTHLGLMDKATLIIFKPGAVEAARLFVQAIELQRRTSAASPVASWQFLVEHNFKGPVDPNSAAALERLEVPSSIIRSLEGSDIIMGVFSHTNDFVIEGHLPPSSNVLHQGCIQLDHLKGVCPKLFSDLPTQGKGFGASH